MNQYLTGGWRGRGKNKFISIKYQTFESISVLEGGGGGVKERDDLSIVNKFISIRCQTFESISVLEAGGGGVKVFKYC